jgi:hypothetical protein
MPLTCLTDRVDRLADSDGNLLFFQLFVEGDEELRIHGIDDPEEHPVGMAQHDCDLQLCFSLDDANLHFFASINDTRTASKPAMAGLDNELPPWKYGLIPIVPLPI